MRGKKCSDISPLSARLEALPRKIVEMGRLAIRTGMWTLFEIEHGKFKLSRPGSTLVDKARRKPLEEYLRMQGRFTHLTEEDARVSQKWTDETWENYKKLQPRV